MPLSQVLAYNTEHLVDAAEHWQGLADQREEVFATVRNEALSLPWDGQAADATHQRTQADHDTAMESAGNLRQAAMIAKDGASTLDQMHSRALYTLEDAQADGFAPTEALAFVDTQPSANPAELAQRQQQALAYTGQLQSQVADLYTHDTQVGADMSNATAGEGKIQFTDSGGGQDTSRGHIQAVGHGFKTDSGAGQNPGPSPVQPGDLGGLLGAPPGDSFVDQYERALTAPPAAPPTSPIPMPAGPPVTPPHMGPEPPPTPAPAGPAEVDPTPGGLLAAAGGGCLAGGMDGGLVGAPIPITEIVTVPGGCIGGGLVTGGMYLGGIWVDNMLNGNG